MEENIISKLEGALQSANMELSEFGHIFPAKSLLPYPTSEKDVTAFIKERTELYRKTWLVEPIKSVLSMIRGTS